VVGIPSGLVPTPKCPAREVEAVKQISSLEVQAARMKWGDADQSPHRHACRLGIAADFAAGTG